MLVFIPTYLLYARWSSPASVYAADQKIYAAIPTDSGKNAFLKQSAHLTQAVDPELADLDSQIISCGSNIDALLSGAHSYDGSCIGNGGLSSDMNSITLGGQCCGALMNTDEYHENLQKLQAYKQMPDIPLDPMHTSIALAKKWMDYDKATTLTADEQRVYDQAISLSMEGPCCCKCWHYYVNEGIAKKMIKDKTFSAQQIAHFWDASDICG